ncbi:hypothetical protein P355_0878 [Burkholderia cenocepacia KC-01]|nr:hypothetical protein P355_0878 [Burkholderia cenocepacia KC-01]
MAPGALRCGNVHAAGNYYDLFSGGILCNFSLNEKHSCYRL